jgi:hypothetical protein
MEEIQREVLSVRNYKAGYQVRTERLTDNVNPPVTLRTAYTPDDEYIGTSRWAYRLCKVRGIKPEIRPGGFVCSIGFSEQAQKWYGWSHRALFGFSIGDTVEEGDCCASSGWTDEYLEEHPEADMRLPVGFEAKTLDDARKMAIAFASSVG